MPATAGQNRLRSCLFSGTVLQDIFWHLKKFKPSVEIDITRPTALASRRKECWFYEVGFGISLHAFQGGHSQQTVFTKCYYNRTWRSISAGWRDQSCPRPVGRSRGSAISWREDVLTSAWLVGVALVCRSRQVQCVIDSCNDQSSRGVLNLSLPEYINRLRKIPAVATKPNRVKNLSLSVSPSDTFDRWYKNIVQASSQDNI
jgi:hypothetical protein